MSGDFSRDTFDPGSAYSRVLLQQGRVLLDADFNEQSAVQLHLLRTLVVDLVGRYWRAGASSFLIDVNGESDFKIGTGRYYVDGLPCDNADPGLTYRGQFGAAPGPEPRMPTGDWFLVYLECWERQVSAVQRPELRDVALGGADTCCRAKIEWQVRFLDAGAEAEVYRVMGALQRRRDTSPMVQHEALDREIATLGQAWKDLAALPSHDVDAWQQMSAWRLAQSVLEALDAAPARLRVRARPADASGGSVTIDAGGYQGSGNQLYRIEIHRGGLAGAGATWKWSRENASVEFAIQSCSPGSGGEITLVLDDMRSDLQGALHSGDWVELTGEAVELGQASPLMARVTGMDPRQQSITVNPAVGERIPTNPALYTVARRWDHASAVPHGALGVVESATADAAWIPLEQGIEVQFAAGAVYHAGDHWLVPARAASADVYWPRDASGVPAWRTRHGADRNRAALAFAFRSGSTAEWTYRNVGCTIMPLCDQQGVPNA